MTDTEPINRIDLYWRPGCFFCSSLRASLRRSGIPVNDINIWNDLAAAERVRAVAGGNETVPTVFVGPDALVAPTRKAVIALIADRAPHLLPPVGERRSGRLRRILEQLRTR